MNDTVFIEKRRSFLQREAKVLENDCHAGLKQISAYIKANLGADISLVHCADLIPISPSYLSRLFKRETGMSFLEFVTECRIDEAKKLLNETDLRVVDIAAAIGYSERNLNRNFLRYTRMSPGQYRAARR